MRDEREGSTSGPEAPRGVADRVVRFFAGPPGWLDGAPVTRVAVWSCALVLAGELLLAQRGGGASLFGALPERVLLAFGGNYAIATMREARVETLVASCFVHASVLHAVVNLLSLRNVGPLVERMAGSARMAPLLLVTGAGGSVVSAAVGMATDGGERLGVGASGALFGVLGAAMVAGWRVEGFRGGLTQTMLRWLVFWLGFGVLVSGKEVRIDNAAHAGGAVSGMLVAAAWQRGRVYSPRARGIVYAACGLVVAATAVTTAGRVLASPYAELSTRGRLERAAAALDAGDCPEARRATAAVARLLPRAPEVEGLAAVVRERCGPPVRP